MINWFQTNFLLHLNCHRGMADCKVQTDSTQTDFLLEDDQGAKKGMQEQADAPKTSHQDLIFPTIFALGQGCCLQLATLEILLGLEVSMLLCPKRMVLAALRLFQPDTSLSHLQINLKTELLASSAKGCMSVCQFLRNSVLQFLSKAVPIVLHFYKHMIFF